MIKKETMIKKNNHEISEVYHMDKGVSIKAYLNILVNN